MRFPSLMWHICLNFRASGRAFRRWGAACWSAWRHCVGDRWCRRCRCRRAPLRTRRVFASRMTVCIRAACASALRPWKRRGGCAWQWLALHVTLRVHGSGAPRGRAPQACATRHTRRVTLYDIGCMRASRDAVIACGMCSKGISGSALPYKRTPPTWLKATAADVEDHVCKLAKKGLTPSQIGVQLRDSLGIAQVR